MELISLESAEEAQQLADYLRPGKNYLLLAKFNTFIEFEKLKPLSRHFFSKLQFLKSMWNVLTKLCSILRAKELQLLIFGRQEIHWEQALGFGWVTDHRLTELLTTGPTESNLVGELHLSLFCYFIDYI